MVTPWSLTQDVAGLNNPFNYKTFLPVNKNLHLE